MTQLSVPGIVLEYFPYPKIRPSQGILMGSIYRSLHSGKSVVIEGANGLGKTVGVLSAVLPLAKENGYRVLYCARTHGQMDRVIEELKMIGQKKRISGISIRGRTGMCVHEFLVAHRLDAREAMEACHRLRFEGRCPYYERINRMPERRAKMQKRVRTIPHTTAEILDICKRGRFCPYEFIKITLDQVDVVALSYIYLLDNVVRENFMRNFTVPLGEFIVVFDEAHNLPRIAVDVMSRGLTLTTIKRALKEARRHECDEIKRFCKSLSRMVKEKAGQLEEERLISPLELTDWLDLDDPFGFLGHMIDVGKWIGRDRLIKGQHPRSNIRSVGEFLLRWWETAKDSEYAHLLSKREVSGETRIRLEILALAPDKVIVPILKSSHLTIHISGTLEPMDVYAKMVGLPEGTPSTSLPSPFHWESVITLICKGVRTDFEHRTPVMYEKLARRVAEAIRYTPANVGIFAASYEVLEGLVDAGLVSMSTKKIFRERRGVSSTENDILIRDFKSCAGKGGAVLLGVQGGRNAEGQDYPGDLMNTSVVVGVPYAKPLPRTQAHEGYYERIFPGHGREYGYVVPALRRAAQAAGRSIRSLRDRGACIFLDYRFSTDYLKRYLPNWMKRNLKILPDEDGAIAKELILFHGLPK